jgi:hypothetical protein
MRQAELAARLREVREDLYGEYGSQFLADELRIPLRTWLNYESGVVMPAETVLRLIDLARINPSWLLTGQGPKYSRRKRRGEARSRGVTLVAYRGGDAWVALWGSGASPSGS